MRKAKVQVEVETRPDSEKLCNLRVMFQQAGFAKAWGHPEAASKRRMLRWKSFAESERKLTFGTSVLIAPLGPLTITPKSGWN